MIDKPNNSVLKAYTGLEGGVVASGSTCGVVSGGAMGLASSHYDELMANGLPAQVGMLSFIFDGGVGLQGGVCGALAGAIMGINLLVGLNIRNTSYYQSVKAFTVGHINLLKNKPVLSAEPFNVGKQIVQKFKEEAGGMECKVITERNFSKWTEYQSYVKSSIKCEGLIALATKEATRAIDMYKPMVT